MTGSPLCDSNKAGGERNLKRRENATNSTDYGGKKEEHKRQKKRRENLRDKP